MESIGSFVRYYERVHGRTARLLPLIPAARLEWRPAEGAFSFGDLLRHLAGTNRWMWAETVSGRPSRYPGHGTELASGYEETCAYFSRLQGEVLAIFRGLSDEDYGRQVMTPAGAALTASAWLRAMIEHEAHHRGQLYLMLRLIGVATPPIFGLTEAQVKERTPREA